MGYAVVHHSIFVDECAYNIWTARSYGRARRGEGTPAGLWTAWEKCDSCHGHFTNEGPVFYSAIVRGMNAKRFSDFLLQARLNLDPDEHVICIYDGAPPHCDPKALVLTVTLRCYHTIACFKQHHFQSYH